MSIADSINSSLGVTPVSSGMSTDEEQKLNQGASLYGGDAQSAFDTESSLGANLWGTINGTAPSVAATQLQQSLGQNLNTGLAQGAGASGTNAVLARYLASQNTGNSADQIAQAAAIMRAQEVAQARQQLGQVTANQANQAGNLYGTNLQTGLGYANNAATIDTANADRAQKTATGFIGGSLGGLGSALSSYFSSGKGGGGS